MFPWLMVADGTMKNRVKGFATGERRWGPRCARDGAAAVSSGRGSRPSDRGGSRRPTATDVGRVSRRGRRLHYPSPPPTPRPPRSGLPPTKTQPKQAAISRVPRRRWRRGTPGCPLSGADPAALVTVSVVLFMLLARGVFSLPVDSNGPTKSDHLLRRSIYEAYQGWDGRKKAISGRRCSRGNPVRSNITISWWVSFSPFFPSWMMVSWLLC
ncbi:unnamed protein product [Musa hybrid cultivar]